MKHKGIEYEVIRMAAAGIWEYRFQIGDQVKVGKIETMLAPLAARRVQMRIDRELKKLREIADDRSMERSSTMSAMP